MLQDSSRATYRGIVLTGFLGGLSLGALNAMLYLFFLLPMVAHHLFHTYLHYDADVLGYAAGYVGILGIMGIAAVLLVPRAVLKKLSYRRIASEPLRQRQRSASDGPSEPK